jgi:hypothetical protein
VLRLGHERRFEMQRRRETVRLLGVHERFFEMQRRRETLRFFD